MVSKIPEKNPSSTSAGIIGKFSSPSTITDVPSFIHESIMVLISITNNIVSNTIHWFVNTWKSGSVLLVSSVHPFDVYTYCAASVAVHVALDIIYNYNA